MAPEHSYVAVSNTTHSSVVGHSGKCNPAKVFHPKSASAACIRFDAASALSLRVQTFIEAAALVGGCVALPEQKMFQTLKPRVVVLRNPCRGFAVWGRPKNKKLLGWLRHSKGHWASEHDQQRKGIKAAMQCRQQSVPEQHEFLQGKSLSLAVCCLLEA